MAARAIWKGELRVGEHKFAVKLYSAVEDRTIHFHLLHTKDHAPVQQHIVRKDTGDDVDKTEMRKAFSIDRQTAIILQPDELQKLEPPESPTFTCVDSSRLRSWAINGTTDPTTWVPMAMTTITSHSPKRSNARK